MTAQRKRTHQTSNSLVGERGTIHKQASARVALGYPAPYAVAASSLGFQTIYRQLNEAPGICCARFFAPDRGVAPRPLKTAEDGLPVSASHAVAFSIACETELLDMVRLLVAADLAPLAVDRRATDPLVIVGGPLTSLDPCLVAPLADAVVVGEAEPAMPAITRALVAMPDKASLLATLADSGHGTWVPTVHAEPPPPCRAPLELLPAVSATWSPRAEFKNLFLVEATRGCRHGCTFCVLSARSNCAGKFRAPPVETVLAAIPSGAPGVGLVGAAVTDHPEIEFLVARITKRDQRVSLSSIRADRLTPELAQALCHGGLRSLTLAVDGASESLRRALHKQLSTADLSRAAQVAVAAGIKRLKLYVMVGLPDETDTDMDELVRLTAALDKRLHIAIAAQAFVPKPNTPLSQIPMAPPSLIRRRLALLGRALRGRARLIPTSPRRSWLDWKLAHAGEKASLAAIRSNALGGTFAAWKQAIEELEL